MNPIIHSSIDTPPVSFAPPVQGIKLDKTIIESCGNFFRNRVYQYKTVIQIPGTRNQLVPVSLGFELPLLPFFKELLNNLKRHQIQLTGFYLKGGAVRHILENENSQLTDIDFSIYLDPSKNHSFTLIQQAFLESLIPFSKLGYTCNNDGTITYQQETTILCTIPNSKIVEMKELWRIFLYQGSLANRVLVAEQNRFGMANHFAIYTLPTFLQTTYQELDFQFVCHTTNACVTSFDCRRLCLLRFIESNDLTEIELSAADGYNLQRAQNLSERREFEVEASKIQTIKDGLRVYCRTLLKGIAPHQENVELLFLENFQMQYKAEFFKSNIKSFVKKQYKDNFAKSLLYLFNYYNVIERSTNLDAKKEIQKMLFEIMDFEDPEKQIEQDWISFFQYALFLKSQPKHQKAIGKCVFFLVEEIQISDQHHILFQYDANLIIAFKKCCRSERKNYFFAFLDHTFPLIDGSWEDSISNHFKKEKGKKLPKQTQLKESPEHSQPELSIPPSPLEILLSQKDRLLESQKFTDLGNLILAVTNETTDIINNLIQIIIIPLIEKGEIKLVGKILQKFILTLDHPIVVKIFETLCSKGNTKLALSSLKLVIERRPIIDFLNTFIEHLKTEVDQENFIEIIQIIPFDTENWHLLCYRIFIRWPNLKKLHAFIETFPFDFQTKLLMKISEELGQDQKPSSYSQAMEALLLTSLREIEKKTDLDTLSTGRLSFLKDHPNLFSNKSKAKQLLDQLLKKYAALLNIPVPKVAPPKTQAAKLKPTPAPSLQRKVSLEEALLTKVENGYTNLTEEEIDLLIKLDDARLSKTLDLNIFIPLFTLLNFNERPLSVKFFERYLKCIQYALIENKITLNSNSEEQSFYLMLIHFMKFPDLLLKTMQSIEDKKTLPISRIIKMRWIVLEIMSQRFTVERSDLFFEKICQSIDAFCSCLSKTPKEEISHFWIRGFKKTTSILSTCIGRLPVSKDEDKTVELILRRLDKFAALSTCMEPQVLIDQAQPLKDLKKQMERDPAKAENAKALTKRIQKFDPFFQRSSKELVELAKRATTLTLAMNYLEGIYDQLFEETPPDYSSLLEALKLYQKLNRIDKAISLATKSLEKSRFRGEITFEITGQIHPKPKAPLNTIDQNGALHRIIAFLGSLFLEKGDLYRSRSVFFYLQNHHVKEPLAASFNALYLMLTRNEIQGIESIEEGINNYPNDVNCRIAKIQLVQFQNTTDPSIIDKWSQLIALINQVCADFPDSHVAFRMLGVTLELQGKLDLAKQAYKKAIQSYPFDCQALINLGMIYFEEGDFPQALEIFTTISEWDPQNSLAFWYMSDCYCKMHNVDDALRAVNLAIENFSKWKSLDLPSALLSDEQLWLQRAYILLSLSSNSENKRLAQMDFQKVCQTENKNILRDLESSFLFRTVQAILKI